MASVRGIILRANILSAAIIVVLLGSLNPSRAQIAADFVEAETLTDGDVSRGIDAIIDALYRLQTDSGTWERRYGGGVTAANVNAHASGQTTLVTLSLLTAGVSYQDPRLQAALDFLLRQKKLDQTYVRALRAHIWALLPARFLKVLDQERKWLLRSYGYNSGSWSYTSVPMETGYDNSLTQYGLLGLWEASKRGQEIPSRLWQRVEEHYQRTQLADGGWNYRPQWGAARGSMTAAGLTCLFITQDFLHAEDYREPGQPINEQQQAIARGMTWLERNFTAQHHPGGPGDRHEFYYHYYLYGIERVGLAGGYKWFGRHDWFREGAAAIINRLCEPVVDAETGRIIRFQVRNDLPNTGPIEPPVVQLAFSLMFLARGRVPIIVSKLRDDGIAWNNRPRDAAHLTDYISDQVEQPLNWQILDIDRPLAEWFDGPLVYLASHKPLHYVDAHRAAYRSLAEAIQEYEHDYRDGTLGWRATRPLRDNPTTVDRIRRYLELGGLLLTCADASGRKMTESVYSLGREMFPQYDWRELPLDHWIYTLAEPSKNPPVFLALSNGVRELMIHSPKGDLGLMLQLNEHIKERAAFDALTGLYYYASERGMTRQRLERKLHEGIGVVPLASIVPPESGGTGSKSGGEESVRRLTILRGMYEGNWHPEPASDELLALRLAEARGVSIEFANVNLVDLMDVGGSAAGARFLWVRGTERRAFSDHELDGISSFVDRGGVVLFETVGGRPGSLFARSAESALLSRHSGARFRRDPRHPVITGIGLPGGVDCSRVTYRLYSLERFGNREDRPRLRILQTTEQDRASVFVSRDDLSQALLGQPCWGISGYVTEDAVNILGNLVQYAYAQ